jgi:lysozyme
MQPTDRALAIIREFEGCRLTAYKCPAGVWTIGWGATGPGIYKGVVWTQDQADRRLLSDVAATAHGVSQLLGNAPTTQGQFDALISFAYNVGTDIDSDSTPEGLGDSTLLKKHLRGDFAGAAAEFPKWNKAKGRILPGLTKRREKEEWLYVAG